MTDITERLAEIEARVEAADAGPWRVRGPQVDPSWKWAAGVESTSLDPDEVDTTIAEVVDAPDAEFIAHARTDVPWLIEQVRELQAESERLRTALRRKENHRARARERVRQRDEVIERVRAILTCEHVPGADWYEDSARVADAIAALEGDGR